MIDAEQFRHFGLLSDSHGHVPITRVAVDLLKSRGAEFLIYLGDVGAEEVIDVLAGEPAALTLGNCDWPAGPLVDYASFLGIHVLAEGGPIQCGQRRCWMTHGHLHDQVQQRLTTSCQYLFHGHTHVVNDEMYGETRILNPGALHRADRYTVGLLDVETDTWDVLEVTPPLMNR